MLIVGIEVGSPFLNKIRKHNGNIIKTRKIQLFPFVAVNNIHQTIISNVQRLPKSNLLLQIIMLGDRFLSLCDPHGGIIHQFGSEGTCTKPAAVCLKGCNEFDHMQKATKHEFINAREFYAIVESIRHKYASFKIDFKEVYFKMFMKEIENCINSFENYLTNDFFEKNPMVEIFCKYTTGGDMFHQIIEDNLEDIEFSEVVCKEVFQLKQFEKLMHRESREEQDKRMFKLLSKIFEHHLRNQKILPNPKDQKADKKNNPLSIFIQHDKLQEAVRKFNEIDYSAQKIENLVFKMRKYQQQVQNSEKADQLFLNLGLYIQKKTPERLIIAVNVPLVVNPFWERLVKLTQEKGMKQIVITTSSESVSENFKSQLSANTKCNIETTLQYNVKWQKNDQILYKKT